MEPWRLERTWTYAEDHGDALVARPRDEAALREVILRARKEGKKITFQAGAQSLDRHALSTHADQVVVVMDAFDRISFDEPEGPSGDAWVTAGAGARWGSILQACEHRGLVPYVVVTSSHASVGGTVAGDCLSRFTTDFGKESKLVAGMRLMNADGEIVELSRDVAGCQSLRPPSAAVAGLDPMLGIIGGFGLLGALIEVQFLAHRVADQGDKPLAVRSIVRKYTQLQPSIEALLSRAYKLVANSEYENPKGLYAVASYSKDDPDRWMNILICSYYVRAAPEHGRRMPQHQSESFWRPIGEWLKRIPGFTPLFWSGVHKYLGSRYVDPLFDYTFFMDGNVRTKTIERAWGIRTRVRQQTYLIPAPAVPARKTFDARLVVEFFQTLRTCFIEHGLEPILLDVLFVPEDDAYLSGSRAMSAVAVTVAFEPLTARGAQRVEAALHELAARAGRVGGRVHLTKRVCADPAVVAAAYGPGLRALARLRDAMDPERLFDSAFAENVLRPAARHIGVDL